MAELRFFIDHGVIHDRKRGRHVLGSESDAAIFGEPLQDTVDALNAMEAATQEVGGLRSEYLDECRNTPVAWMTRGACTSEPVFTTTPPDEPSIAGWTPLYAALPYNAELSRRQPAKRDDGRT